MRKILSLALAAALCAAGCGAFTRGTIGPSTPPVQIALRAVAVFVRTASGLPVAGAVCGLDGVTDQGSASNADGYVLFRAVPASLRDTQLICTKQGFEPYSAHRVIQTAGNETLDPAVLVFLHSPLPPPPTRDNLLNVHLTFQGLWVDTVQFGRLPWFEAALPWLGPEDRQAVYKAKHESQAWGDGDTHVIISLPSGPPLYDEPGQPYSADRFPALDWTAGNTQISPAFGELVAEVIHAGFPQVLVFLGGDDGHAGYEVATAQLPLVINALRNTAEGDLLPYTCIGPGWDGVWHAPGPNGTGYAREDIIAFGQQFRALAPEGCLFLEHASGYLPIGEGGGDFLPGGGMTTYDLILSEFDGPYDTPWRQTMNGRDGRGFPNYQGNQIWQIAGRLVPDYVHPADQPADADAARAPYYLAPLSPRGPFRACAFEWTGEYFFVRGRESTAAVDVDRNYFKGMGYTCGG